MAASKGKKPAEGKRSDRSNQAKGPRKSRGTLALELVAKAKDSKSPVDVAAAIMALTGLKQGDPAVTDPDVRKWWTDHAAEVFEAERGQAKVIDAAKAAADAAADAAKAAKGQLRTAQHGQAERTRDAQVLVYGMLDVHHLFRTASDLGKRYSMSEPTVSRYRRAGEALVKVLESTSPTTAQGVATALTHDRKATTAAIRAGDRDRLRTLIAEATGKRTAQEAQRGADSTDHESRPPAEQATELASTLASVLTVLNSSAATPMADLESSTGIDAYRRVVAGLHAYSLKQQLPWPEPSTSATDFAKVVKALGTRGGVAKAS